VARGRIDVAFMRAEPDYDLEYKFVSQEPLIVLMPSDHRLAACKAVRPADLRHESFIRMADKAKVLRGVIDSYLARWGIEVQVVQSVDNPAMVMSLVASLRAVTLIPAYVENLMPSSVTGRPLAGEVPTIDLVMGYSRSNTAPILKLFLSQGDELAAGALSARRR
jgi:LysR family hca operon transcriptional activator